MPAHIHLPTFHPGQVRVFNERERFNVVCCGRRWGKTKMLTTLAGDTGMKGRNCGIFTPESAQWAEPFDDLAEALLPALRSRDASKGKIRLVKRGPLRTGGKLDFWHTNDKPLAGRGREYHRVVGDEFAFGKLKQLGDIWSKSIRPTISTTQGDAWIFSTPFGDDPDNFFWQLCHEPKWGFKFHYAPSSDSPYMPPEELELIRGMEHPLVFQQEYLAKFVSWGETAFFMREWMLGLDGLPVEYPNKCDQVFAIMDCSAKSGSANDGTGVLYCAFTKHSKQLILLDYELHSINAAFLEGLAPTVLARCEALAKQCGAREGSRGVFVEDAAGGIVLLQQAAANGWPMFAIPSDLMSKGKDERAMLAGGPVYRRSVMFSRHAFDKQIEWKRQSANHLLRQIEKFRMGDKDAFKRADDLLDCFAYAVVIALVDWRAAQ